MAGCEVKNSISFTVPSTQVELTLAAKNLRDKDVLSKSDPRCVIYMREKNSQRFHEIGRTELIKDCLNPSWTQKIVLDYYFEERQHLRFHVFDWDTKSEKVESQDSLGLIECSLGEIMSRQGSHFTKNLNSNGGMLMISGEEMCGSKELVTLQLSARELDKKDLLGKSDPFLVIHRALDDRSYVVIHRTEAIKKNLNPTWRPFTLPKHALSPAGDDNRTIKIQCFDWDSDGEHDLIGECQTNLSTLKLGSGPKNTYTLINEKKRQKKSSYKGSGQLVLNNIGSHYEPSFLDYIKGGLQLHFTVAIDFTASNGDPRDEKSLHYWHPQGDNQYSLAIKAVGEVVQDYDSDKMLPALGFGARVPPDFAVSHEFFLNGTSENPYCLGVQGILDAYRRSLSSVTLFGPTNFSPVVQHVCQFAKAHQDGSNYFILLIITDGIITDIQETKKALVEASHFPMSVIIVGVGAEDFSAMKLLDGDERQLSYNGIYAKRDIVQFVELRKHMEIGGGLSFASKTSLAKDVLAEVPGQLVSWMKSKQLLPKPCR